MATVFRVPFDLQVPGCDVSSWQDNPNTPQEIDWTKPRLSGPVDIFVVNRACMGATEDRIYRDSINDQGKLGYFSSAYGFWDNRSGAPSVETQAIAFASIVRKTGGITMPVIWMDFEQANANYPPLPPRAQSLAIIERYMKIVEDITGIKCGLYTSPRHIRHTLMADNGVWKDIPSWLTDKPLWVAAWPTKFENETPEEAVKRTGIEPNLYGQWEYYTLWQYTSKQDGKANGFETDGLDGDAFNGTHDDFYKWCGKENPPEEGDTEKMWESNLVIASFDKAGAYTLPTQVDFSALKAAGFEAVLLRSGSSDATQNYDDPSADFINDPRFPAWFDLATAAGLRVLIDYDFNPMIDVVQGHIGSRTKQHINYLLSGGNKPTVGGGLLLNCERNTWTESGKPKTQPANMYSQDLKAVFDWVWGAEKLVPGVRTGQWFLDKQDETKTTYRSQLGWMDKGSSVIPLFLVRLKTDKIPVGTQLNGNIHDLISGIQDPANTMITVNGSTVSEQSFYLYFGNNTKWRGWELAWIKHPAVKDANGNLAVFRTILWNGDKKDFDAYFNFPGTTPDPDPDPDPEPDTELEQRVTNLEGQVDVLNKNMETIIEMARKLVADNK